MLPSIDIAQVTLEARRLCEELAQACEDASLAAGAEGGAPDAPQTADLCDALHRALVALDAQGSKLSRHVAIPGQPPQAQSAAGLDDPGAPDLGALADHGIDLLAHLSALAGRLRLPQHARQIEALALPLACWAARRGAELGRPAPVVNAAAGLANGLKTPADLATLYGLMSEVVDAMSPKITQDRDPTDATRPWRILLLNRAIVATRSHRRDLMEAAFDAIVDDLPGDAPDFFREAMAQMDALDYPRQVRAVVERYAETWSTPRILH
jgi:hypothetical protein